MTDTLFADVSEFQRAVNDQYPYQFLSIRSNDGTYKDKRFAENFAWVLGAVKRKRLTGFIVYFVWEPGVANLATLAAQVGSGHHPRMAVMIDVESWGGKIKGDHSKAINATRSDVIAWLNSQRPRWQRKGLAAAWFRRADRRRVIGYGNLHDLQTIWPDRGDVRLIIADYGDNPDFPGKIAHQFSSKHVTPPFGACDINSADGRTPRQFARQLGLGGLRWVL